MVFRPDKQQITDSVQGRQRLRRDLEVTLAIVPGNRNHPRHRITFREAVAQPGSHQQIADLDVGTLGHVSEFYLIEFAYAVGYQAHIVAGNTHRQAVFGVGEQQHPGGEFADLHHLADNPLGIHHRLTDKHTVAAAVVDHHIMMEWVAGHFHHLCHHLARVHMHRRAQQFTQALVFLAQVFKTLQSFTHQQLLAQEFFILLLQHVTGRQTLGRPIQQLTWHIGQVL